jgi:membrane-bound inhibitor of C-type lysozyme
MTDEDFIKEMLPHLERLATLYKVEPANHFLRMALMAAMAYKDPNEAPKADSTRYYKCDACEHLHVMLVDEDDCTFATAVIDRKMLLSMLDVIDGAESPNWVHH